MDGSRFVRLTLVWTAVLLLAATAAFGEAGRTSEATLDDDYAQRVTPFFQSGFAGILTGRGNARLVYRKWELEKERGAVVFVTGWTETAQKYAELIYTLSSWGYSVYTVDNRGMGLSSRLAPNRQVVHVESYDDYVSDLKQFVDRVVKARRHHRIFFVAHSMGGLISTLYAGKYPWDLDGLVVSAPLYQVDTGSFPESVAYSIAKVSSRTGWDRSYILTHGDSTPKESSDFATQTATHSKARWGKKVALWYSVPASFMSGSSNRWLQRTIEATWWVRSDEGAAIRTPMVLFTAGKDTRVWNPGVEAACKRMARCRTFTFPDAYHELFLESDSIRNRLLAEMEHFFRWNE